ncbi:Hypothetical protein CINCED_3A022849 [Cinara cedri]|uniref:Uncharacterized protein n=1 Tax=Cinara cedri TaxID=506608 RepID=A0A5E4NDV9_9HEMI|nr:Hypothetical protein CINCED_3A022849 [Cinara cedri]
MSDCLTSLSHVRSTTVYSSNTYVQGDQFVTNKRFPLMICLPCFGLELAALVLFWSWSCQCRFGLVAKVLRDRKTKTNFDHHSFPNTKLFPIILLQRFVYYITYNIPTYIKMCKTSKRVCTTR